MSQITYEPIGTIHTPFKKPEGMPIQPSGAKGIKGTINLDNKYTEALSDLDGFSHIILLYHLHLSEGFSLKVKPFLDNTKRGLFATRAPRRPNPIGLSVVKLIGIENNILTIENVDIVDGTPLLDIKPYVMEFNGIEEIKTGWLTDNGIKARIKKSDNRFTE
jgi:tRNA (adenine37-N6)-methyltransferase